MARDFYKWLTTFTNTLRTPNYWVDWNKVLSNVNKYKDELNILNGIVGVKNIEKEFRRIVKKYPLIITCIPILIAVRSPNIEMSSKAISFTLKKYNLDEICAFMEESGLFHFLENKNVKNLIDYLTGIEVGLDSNARKNRGGKEMVNKFRQFLNNAKIMFDEEFSTKQITKKYGIIFPENIKKKRFDFVFKINETIYGVEVNFYSGGGSKLNETAKSYIELNKQFKSIKNFKFLWITDGAGWNSAKNDLRMAFNNIEHLYNINNLKNGILNKLTSFKSDIYDEIDALSDEDALLDKYQNY